MIVANRRPWKAATTDTTKTGLSDLIITTEGLRIIQRSPATLVMIAGFVVFQTRTVALSR